MFCGPRSKLTKTRGGVDGLWVFLENYGLAIEGGQHLLRGLVAGDPGRQAASDDGVEMHVAHDLARCIRVELLEADVLASLSRSPSCRVGRRRNHKGWLVRRRIGVVGDHEIGLLGRGDKPQRRIDVNESLDERIVPPNDRDIADLCGMPEKKSFRAGCAAGGGREDDCLGGGKRDNATPIGPGLGLCRGSVTTGGGERRGAEGGHVTGAILARDGGEDLCLSRRDDLRGGGAQCHRRQAGGKLNRGDVRAGGRLRAGGHNVVNVLAFSGGSLRQKIAGGGR